MERVMNKRVNYNRALVSLTDAMLVWIEESADSANLTMPWVGHETAVCMASAALAVLQAVDDLKASLVEDGELKEEE